MDADEGAATGTVPRRSLLRRALLALGFFVLSVSAGGAVVGTFGTWTYHWRAFEVQVGVGPALRGQTRLIFTPLGEVHAPTHPTPVALKVSLRGIAFDEMKRLVIEPPPRPELERDFRQALLRSGRDFFLRQIALGAAGALLVPLLLRVWRARYWFAAAACGGGFAALVLWGTLHTFEPRAFRSPTYTGSLQQAQWIITLVGDAATNREALGSKLRNVAGNLSVLYGRINAGGEPSENGDTLRVLHISDIHNNPAAVDFVRDLTDRIPVDLVLDTGDLTDFGTPLENQLSRGLTRLNVPYVFVAGNHDSEATVRALRASPGVVVLDGGGGPVTVAGLSLLGAPDPSSARPGAGSVNTGPEALRASGEALLARYRSAAVAPDIVCVHNPRQAEPLLGLARLVLCGHMHAASITEERGTVVCNAGTTGAAGARYFDKPGGVPFSAALLHFTRGPSPRLLFIDQVVLDGSLRQYSITRRTFDAPAPSTNTDAAALPVSAAASGPPTPR